MGEDGERKGEDLRERRNIIRYYDLTFMCSPHVAVLCLFAPQRDMTATLELLKTQISDDYDHGNEEAGVKKKKNRKHQGERRHIDDR